MISATKYHDFSAGHRVFQHESKCAHLHGHNYRVHFTIVSKELDTVGRVLDFSVIGNLLCQWLEENWDHKFLIFKDDPWVGALLQVDPAGVVVTDFNPTAENMSDYLLNVIGPQQLKDTGCVLQKVKIEETRKCSVVNKKGEGEE